GVGTCTAATATANYSITVDEPVVITTQPNPSQTVCSSFPVSFSVAATGTGLTYQWFKNGVALSNIAGVITGVTTPNLSISQAAMLQAGTYTVEVTGTV